MAWDNIAGNVGKKSKKKQQPETAGQKQLRDFAQKEQETGQQGYKPLKKNKRPDSKVEPGRLQAIKQFFSRFTSSR